MEKALVTSYQESADARSIYRDSTSADFAVQNTAAVAGNLGDAMRDAVIVFVHTVYVSGVPCADDPRGPAERSI